MQCVLGRSGLCRLRGVLKQQIACERCPSRPRPLSPPRHPHERTCNWLLSSEPRPMRYVHRVEPMLGPSITS
jgi:hypothetical protein